MLVIESSNNDDDIVVHIPLEIFPVVSLGGAKSVARLWLPQLHAFLDVTDVSAFICHPQRCIMMYV